jgi:hypothetical protein
MAFPNGEGVSNINCPNNAFAQPLPALFGQLPDLTFFSCFGHGNQFTGDLGAAFGHVAGGLTLFSSWGHGNQFSGDLGVAFGHVAGSLTFFNCFGNANQFTGDLGVTFGHVAGVLSLFDCFGNANQFSGDLGVAFGHVAGSLTRLSCGGSGNQFTNIDLTIPTRAIQIFLEPYIWQPGQADATLDGLIADPTLFVTHLYIRNATNGPSPAKVSQLQARGVQVFV